MHSLDRWSRNQLVTLQTLKSLGQHRIAFTSISENIDYSTAEGTLFLSPLGGFSQYFSDALAKASSSASCSDCTAGVSLSGTSGANAAKQAFTPSHERLRIPLTVRAFGSCSLQTPWR